MFRLIGWTLLFALGLLLLRLLPSDADAVLVVLMVAGGGAVWEAAGFYRKFRKERQNEAALQERTKRQATRRERAQTERERRRREREATQVAREREREAQHHAREQAQEARRLQETQRAERQARLEHEAARLSSLSDAALQTELIPLCASRGVALEAADTPISFADALAVSVSGGRCAEPEDVRALEQRRQAVGAEQAYLIALHGFSPEAIGSAQEAPITLIDAHILAQWKETHP